MYAVWMFWRKSRRLARERRPGKLFGFACMTLFHRRKQQKRTQRSVCVLCRMLPYCCEQEYALELNRLPTPRSEVPQKLGRVLFHGCRAASTSMARTKLRELGISEAACRCTNRMSTQGTVVTPVRVCPAVDPNTGGGSSTVLSITICCLEYVSSQNYSRSEVPCDAER